MSKFLRGLGSLIAIAGGLLGFVLSLLVVYAIGGGGGVLLGLFIFPATFALVPFYTLFVYGSWNLLLINYGSMAAGLFLHRIADNMEKQPQALSAEPTPMPAVEQTPKNNPGPAIFLLVVGVLVVGSVISILVSPAPISTSTPKPTMAPPTKRQLPRSTPTPRPISLHACVTNSTIKIRRGPGKQYEVIGGMVSSTCMSVLGRNQEGDWVYMVSEDNKTGWVAASLLTIDGNISSVSVRSTSETLSMASTAKAVPTQKLPPTATRKPLIFSTSTPKAIANPFMPLCSDVGDRIGERLSCKVPRAYCDYLPSVDGSPTFCDDKPYPNHEFQLVVFGEDWSDFDGSCLVVSGYLDTYRGKLQIQATSRSQVSYCP